MGAWNFEELGNWDIDTLIDSGFNYDMWGELGQEQAFLQELLEIVQDAKEQISQEEKTLQKKEYMRVLVSIPIDEAVKAAMPIEQKGAPTVTKNAKESPSWIKAF
jgi:hypothetical protein